MIALRARRELWDAMHRYERLRRVYGQLGNHIITFAKQIHNGERCEPHNSDLILALQFVSKSKSEEYNTQKR